jgi:Alpha-L-arabinofuranosidase C-terminal domain
MKRFLILTALALGHPSFSHAEPDATIRVDAKDILSHVTRYMTGACLEDVNHEVYGGLYSLMIFGESFQGPALPPPIKDFIAYGGVWTVKDGTLSVEPGPGPKLIADAIDLSVGEVGVEVLLPGKGRGVGGLIVKVQEPGTGPDRFLGYEVALSAAPPLLRLGRHRHNWEHIRDLPCRVAAERWTSLVVRLEKTGLEVLVDGQSILKYEDREHPLASGKIGLRAFERPCRFRSLWVRTDGRQRSLAFESVPRWDQGVSGMWRGVRHGTAAGRFELDTQEPFTGRQSQRITYLQGEGRLCIENRGLNRWGLCVREAKPYDGLLWLRALQTTQVTVALVNHDGSRMLAEKRLEVSAGKEWQRYPFTLTPSAGDNSGGFIIQLDHPGSIDIGYALLEPGSWGRFHGLPVRKDVADALVAQGLTALRYGGSMVNAPLYRWKKMIGPRDRRPPYHGTWYPYSSNGWGIVDFVAFCEAAGFLAIPAFNMDETPADMADFVDYINGPSSTAWGRKRAADGHPAPFKLKHLELGNEEAVDDAYWKRFQPLAEAIWAKAPDIILVVGDFAYNGRIKDPFHFPGGPRIRSLAAHQKILELARARGRPVWFDVHVWNHEPRHPAELGGGILGLADFGAALKRLCPRADFQVCVFEENAFNHTLRRGLGHAHAINRLERLGNLVAIVCAANCLQPDQQNDNGWDQGLLFLNPCQVWGQPSYYITQMIAGTYLPQCVRAEVNSPGNALDVTAKRSHDGKLLQLQVVNVDGRPLATELALAGFAPVKPEARVIEIRGQLSDDNTRDNPRRIQSRERAWEHGFKNSRTQYTFPAYSFTILRFE